MFVCVFVTQQKIKFMLLRFSISTYIHFSFVGFKSMQWCWWQTINIINWLHKQFAIHFYSSLIGLIRFYRLGVLACLDGYMNIALDQTEEYSNGQLKNKYGDAFIRGNNVLYISTQKRRV